MHYVDVNRIVIQIQGDAQEEESATTTGSLDLSSQSILVTLLSHESNSSICGYE